MGVKTRMKEVFQNDTNWNDRYLAPTIGTVVDTNDPQQQGRIRIICPSWGETYTNDLVNIPWALHISQFAGTTEVGTRGSDLTQTQGPVAYGLWGVPKVGASAVVICVDGDPEHRVCLGCFHTQLAAHTMPHGRWMYEDHPSIDVAGDQRPFGPLSTTESPIEPLNTNMREAFSNKNEPNYEWRTRAADYTVSSVDVDHLSSTYSKAADDKDVNWDDWNSRQGYQSSRLAPFQGTPLTERNLDSLVYALTSPGFHAVSLDDRQENCRIRVRTTSGHQIIMDDTNERIYISTAQGRNWIEMDQAGNIHMYTDNKLNVHALQEINFTSDKTIRFQSKEGIHFNTDGEMRFEAKQDVSMKFDKNLRVHTSQQTLFLSDQAFSIKSGQDLYLNADQAVNILATGNIKNTGAQIHLNSASNVASPALPPNEQPAMMTNMIPQHEPWARTMTQNDFTSNPELPYTSPQVGRVERGRTIMRGRYWRR